MSPRTRSVLFVALALVFVAAMLLRSGVLVGRPRAAEPPPPVAPVDTLPAAPDGLVWLGPVPAAHAAFTAVVIWNLGDPVGLAAADRAEQWRLLYGALGARVIGVHAPHAAFDGDSAVVAAEVARRGLGYPVAIDGALRWTHALSTAGTRPRVVIADSLGRIRYSGGDAMAAERELERLIVMLHPELAPPGVKPDSADTPRGGIGTPIDSSSDDAGAGHVPVWLGAADRPAGPLADVTPGAPRLFHAELSTEIAGTPWEPTPIGLWTLGADGLTAARGGAQQFVALRYDGAPLAVLAGAARGQVTRLWVLRDDAWLPAAALGADARLDGRGASYVEVGSPRLYEVARPDGKPHVIKLSPEEPGLTLHALVFEPVPPPSAARP